MNQEQEKAADGTTASAKAEDAGLSADGAAVRRVYVALRAVLRDKEKERQGQGFNTGMPMPGELKIIGDKAKAYEQQDLENKRKERRGMVGDLSAFWNDSDGDTPTDDADTSDDRRHQCLGHHCRPA